IFITRDSSAVAFNSGDYEINSYSIIPGEGRAEEAVCRTVNKIGWKIFNNDGCELLSDNSTGNTQSWDLKCESKGIEKMTVSITILDDSFNGITKWREKTSKGEFGLRFTGKRVSSCMEIANILNNTNSVHKSPQIFKHYIKGKYPQIQDMESDVKLTMDGPSGHFSLSGNIDLHSKAELDPAVEPDRIAKARLLAKTFMEEERELLDIKKSDEIVESNILTDNGFGGQYTHLYFKKFINSIEFQGTIIHIIIGPEETIRQVFVDLVPVSPEMYTASAKQSLSEEEIKSIVMNDIRANNINTSGYKPLTPHKYVVIEPPYIIWKVSCYWAYTFDAFTGEVLWKRRNIKK
ncbi:MAG: DUF3617 family protein, partial [Oryzomonas sp.]